jgi:hypothetical protein
LTVVQIPHCHRAFSIINDLQENYGRKRSSRALDLSNLQQEFTKTLRQTGTPAPEALQGQSHGAPIRPEGTRQIAARARRA